MTPEICKRCLRPEAEGPDDYMNVKFCNSDTCEIVREKNVLIAALRSVLKAQDKATMRTAAVLLEEIAGASKDCPLCNDTGAVHKGYVKIHFARVADDKPCRASFKNVIGGILQ